MKNTAIEERFFFHANAVALAAHFRRPRNFYIAAVASSCLPATGGLGTQESPGREFGDLLAYEMASTTVFGDYIDRNNAVEFTHGNHGENSLPTATSAEGRIRGLKIKVGERVLQIGELRAEMSAISLRRSPPEFHSLATEFQNVRIDGARLRVNSDCEMFNRFETKERLVRAFEKDRAFRGRYSHHFFSPSRTKGWLSRFRSPVPESDGILYGTVVSDMQWDGASPKGAVIEGNRVTIAGLGSLYFGEILIEEGLRRLTMIRFQIGSPDGGEGAAVEIQTNGTGWPPRRG